jgi:hypothetical protein
MFGDDFLMEVSGGYMFARFFGEKLMFGNVRRLGVTGRWVGGDRCVMSGKRWSGKEVMGVESAKGWLVV